MPVSDCAALAFVASVRSAQSVDVGHPHLRCPEYHQVLFWLGGVVASPAVSAQMIAPALR